LKGRGGEEFGREGERDRWIENGDKGGRKEGREKEEEGKETKGRDRDRG
jgi:hypothetical protein